MADKGRRWQAGEGGNKIRQSVRRQQDQDQNQQQTTMAYYQNNRLSIKCATTLANLLVESLLLNETIEAYRQALAKTPYFDTIALFRFLDKQEKGYLCEKDFHHAIGTSHRKLLTYAFTWLDNLKAGEISRLQFATSLLPRDDLELRETVAQRLEHPELQQCQEQTILQQYQIFQEMVLEIMRREMKLIELRRALLGSDGYSLRGAILAIDCSRHDWVCIQDIFKFIKNYGFDASLRQVEKLVETINSQLDGKVTEQQLKWTIEGFQGSDRAYLSRIKHCNKKEPPKKPINFEDNFRNHLRKKLEKKSPRQAEARNPIEGIYRQLLEKKRLIELEAKEIDQNLVLQQQLSEKHNRAECEKERINLQLAREMEASRRMREREEWIAKIDREKQLQSLLDKASETERLARVLKRQAIAQDSVRIKQNLYSEDYMLAHPKRYHAPVLPAPVEQVSFGFDSVQADLLRLSRNQAIRAHLQSSDAYLEATRQLRQKIKREREIQKKIHQQFIAGPGSKYGAYPLTEPQRRGILDTIAKDQDQKMPGHIKGSRKGSFKESELGLQTIQKKPSTSQMPILDRQEPAIQQQGLEDKEGTLRGQFATPDPKLNQERSKVGASTTLRS